MSRISFLFVLLLLSSCWGRHALEVSRNYVPVFNPGGVLFDEDENFARSYEVYEKRRHDVLREKARHRKGARPECETGCPSVGEEKRSWIVTKLREFGAVSRDVIGSVKGGMVNREGIDLSALPGARFVDIVLEEDDDGAEDTKHTVPQEVVESHDTSLEPKYIERESGFPLLETHKMSAREAREFGCDCDKGGVRHEHDAKNSCDCGEGDASEHQRVEKEKTANGSAEGAALTTGSVTAGHGADASHRCNCGSPRECECQKVTGGHLLGGLEEVECACERSHECECKRSGFDGDAPGEVECSCDGAPDCVCSRGDSSQVTGRPGTDCECDNENGCGCGKGASSGHKHKSNKLASKYPIDAVKVEQGAVGVGVGTAHECDCGQHHECGCGSERMTGNTKADCECKQSHSKCDCIKGSAENASGDRGQPACECDGAPDCDCRSDDAGRPMSGPRVDCEHGNLHDFDSDGDAPSGRKHKSSKLESSHSGGVVAAEQFDVADTNANAVYECDCEKQHACECGNGHKSNGSGTDCECGKTRECTCKKGYQKHGLDCCDVVQLEQEAVSRDVEADVADDFTGEPKETIARWEVGEIVDEDLGDEPIEVAEEVAPASPEKDDENGVAERESDADDKAASGDPTEEVVDEFSDGLMEEGFSINDKGTYTHYDWSGEISEDDFADLMGDVAFPKKDMKESDANKGRAGHRDTAAAGSEKKMDSLLDEMGQRGSLHSGKNALPDSSGGLESADPWGAQSDADEYVADDDQLEDAADDSEEWSSFSNDAGRREGKSYLNVYAWQGF